MRFDCIHCRKATTKPQSVKGAFLRMLTVFHVNRSTETDNLGYAVYIHDMEPLAFADSLGIDQGTSASLTDEDGNENTYSLFNNDEVKSPIAIRTFDLWSYGQSAYIPSVRQLSYLFSVRHQINECINQVRGTPINLNPGECWLWSSTEVEGQKENKAWLYSMQYDQINKSLNIVICGVSDTIFRLSS